MLATAAHGPDRVGALAGEQARVGGADRAGAAERAGRAQQRERLAAAPGVIEPRERVADPLDVRRGRAGELGRAQERGVGAVAARDLGDLGRVGRDNDRVEQPGLDRGGDRVGDQRMAGERPDVLARHALGSGAGRDQRDRAGH
jgi:hypothetical protein